MTTTQTTDQEMTPEQHLAAAVATIKANNFVAGYEASDEQAIGIAVAHYFEWDSRIVEACFRALEDANFHTLAEPLWVYVQAEKAELAAEGPAEGPDLRGRRSADLTTST